MLCSTQRAVYPRTVVWCPRASISKKSTRIDEALRCSTTVGCLAFRAPRCGTDQSSSRSPRRGPYCHSALPFAVIRRDSLH